MYLKNESAKLKIGELVFNILLVIYDIILLRIEGEVK